MDFSDIAGLSPAQILDGRLVLEGKAQLLVADIEEREGQYGDYVSVTLQVVAHENESEVGKTFFASLSNGGEYAQKAALKFAWATGIYTQEAFANAQAKNETDLVIPWEDANGTTFFTELRHYKKKTGDTKCTFGWNLYSWGAPEVKELGFPVCDPEDLPQPGEELDFSEDVFN